MAILATLFALGSRFAGKILTTALGWASTLLFGRVPADRQVLLLGITFGSVIWIVLLVGVAVPDVGAFLLLLVPPQDVVPESVIRLVMIGAALILPAVVGALTLAVTSRDDLRPGTVVRAIGRGYPLTALLAGLLVFLACLAVWRKGRSVVHRWTDAHVPIVVQPGAYDKVAADLDRAVSAAGLDVTPQAAPRTMSLPARWLATVAGGGSGELVPDRMVQLKGPELDILIYPMDLLISGAPSKVMRARAAMASRLTTTSAHLTVTAEGQAIEDRLTALARGSAGDAGVDEAAQANGSGARTTYDADAERAFEAIDRSLATVEVPYEEWETLYRQRLQVERDLRARAMAEASRPVGAIEQVRASGALASLGRLVRSGAGLVVDVAADERTSQAIDRLAGPEWRWAARAASVAVDAAREVLTPADEAAASREIKVVTSTGEPAAYPAEERRPDLRRLDAGSP